MNVYQIVTDRILTMLDNGVAPWRKPWKGGAAGVPSNHATGYAYRGVNVFLLAAAGYAVPRFLTFKQALALGGCVRKGEHGLPVIFWKQTTYKDKASETGERKGFILRYYTVFNVAQCDGVETDAPSMPVLPSIPPIEAADAIVEGYAPRGPRIVHDFSARACYRPGEDCVNMPLRDQFNGSAEYYSTLFHELGHSTGHESRLARLEPTSFGSHAYSREELVAEFTAAFLCGTAGIEAATLENSAAYLAGWAHKLRQPSNAQWVVTAAAQAQKAADLILGRDFSNKPAEAVEGTALSV
jgi:antirestriction protein ArdC